MTEAEISTVVAITVAAASEIIALSPARDNSILQVILRFIAQLFPYTLQPKRKTPAALTQAAEVKVPSPRKKTTRSRPRRKGSPE